MVDEWFSGWRMAKCRRICLRMVENGQLMVHQCLFIHSLSESYPAIIINGCVGLTIGIKAHLNLCWVRTPTNDNKCKLSNIHIYMYTLITHYWLSLNVYHWMVITPRLYSSSEPLFEAAWWTWKSPQMFQRCASKWEAFGVLALFGSSHPWGSGGFKCSATPFSSLCQSSEHHRNPWFSRETLYILVGTRAVNSYRERDEQIQVNFRILLVLVV